MTPTISFCTTCYNRQSQLEATFKYNAAIIAKNIECEWVVVDFGSKGAPFRTILEQLPKLTSRVRYFSEDSGRPWHLSRAKNVAHRLATGEILVSLDCDNFIGDSVAVVRQFLLAGISALHMWSGVPRDGTSGRIAVTREAFFSIGGYDEEFRPMGYQDLDFLARISASKRTVLHWPCGAGVAIPNLKSDSVVYCSPDGENWEDYDRENRAISRSNIASGRLIANKRIGWHPISGREFIGQLS